VAIDWLEPSPNGFSTVQVPSDMHLKRQSTKRIFIGIIMSSVLHQHCCELMVMNMRALLTSACVVGFFIGVGPAPSIADSIVVKSTNNSFSAGELLADGAVIKLEEKDSLSVMDKNTRETLTLTGPYEGTIANYSGGCSTVSRVFGHCHEVTPPVPLGGTRGIQR
jgi:hypothetical protein